MKIILENPIIKIYINDISKLDFTDMDNLENYFRKLFLKIKRLSDITLTGLYDIHIYLDAHYGAVIELKKEQLEYIDYDDNEIDMRISIHDSTFLYEVSDIFMISDVPYQSVYYYKNKIYIEPKQNLNVIDCAKLYEMSEICYKTDDIIHYGKKIKQII